MLFINVIIKVVIIFQIPKLPVFALGPVLCALCPVLFAFFPKTLTPAVCYCFIA